MGRFENAEVFRDTERMCREEPVGTIPNVVCRYKTPPHAEGTAV